MMNDSSDRSDARSNLDPGDAIPTPSQSGNVGGETARSVGSRDEERMATGGDPEPARVEKKDKVQPDTGTRADREGTWR
jgi:hypothetical protein